MKLNKIYFISFLFLLCIFTSASFAKPTSESGVFPQLTYLVQQGNFSKAEQLINSTTEKNLKSPFKERFQFIQAYLHLQNGNFSESEKIFEDLKRNYPQLKNYSSYYLAQTYRKSGKPEKGIPILEELQKGELSSYLKGRVKIELAHSYCHTKDPEKGLKLFDQLLLQESAPHPLYHLQFERAQCLIAIKKNSEAATLLKGLYLKNLAADLSQPILKSLKTINQSPSSSEYFDRSERLMLLNRPDLAIVDLEYAFAGRPSLSGFDRKKLAETYFKARRYAEAAEQYEKLRKNFPESFDLQEDLLQLGKSYSRSDQWDHAIGIYREEMSLNPKVDRADNLYKMAYLTMDQGKFKEANEKFKELLAQFPSHPKKNQIEWFIAWNQYLLKNHTDAKNRFSEIASKSSGVQKNRATYWQAKSLEKLGHRGEAESLYRQITQREPFSYYAFLSIKKLENNSQANPPPRGSFTSDLPHFSKPRFFDFSELKKSDPLLKELFSVGLWEDLIGEWKSGQIRDPFFRSLFDENFASYTIPNSGNGTGERWQERYPTAYPMLVSFFGESRDLPIPLAWSIMREESHFRPEVVSPAQAIGLMQMIPPTAQEVANSMHRRHFMSDELFQPSVNIEFGTQYLATNLQRFGQNLIKTIASYNAGEQAVERWNRVHSDLEWDEFVEEIPYSETQDYVRKVLKSFYIYQLLYF